MRLRRKDVICAVVPIVCIALFAIGMLIEGYVSVVLLLGFVLVALVALLGWGRLRDVLYSNVEPDSQVFRITASVCLLLLPAFHSSSSFVLYVDTRIFVLSTMLLALTLSLGATGLVDLSLAAFVGVGAYISARASLDIGVPVLVCPLLGGIIGGVLALAVGSIVLRARGHYFSLATLGLGLVAYNAFIQLESMTGGVDGIPNIPRVLDETHLGSGIELLGLPISLHLVSCYWVLLCFLVVLFFVRRLRSGQLGRCFRAVRDNEAAAISFGVNPLKYRLLSYSTSASIAAFAGGLHAHTVNFVAPGDFGFQSSVFLLSLAVLGGIGKPASTISAAFLIVFLEEKLREFGDLRMLLVATAIILVLIYRARIHSAQVMGE